MGFDASEGGKCASRQGCLFHGEVSLGGDSLVFEFHPTFSDEMIVLVTEGANGFLVGAFKVPGPTRFRVLRVTFWVVGVVTHWAGVFGDIPDV